MIDELSVVTTVGGGTPGYTSDIVSVRYVTADKVHQKGNESSRQGASIGVLHNNLEVGLDRRNSQNYSKRSN